MTDYTYKKYSISKLREWIGELLCSGEASAKEIYDTILNEVKDHTSCLQKQYENGRDLQELLLGHRPIESFQESWSSIVEEDIITGEQWITFPPELIQKLDWKEGDNLEWIDNYDGTYTIQKVK